MASNPIKNSISPPPIKVKIISDQTGKLSVAWEKWFTENFNFLSSGQFTTLTQTNVVNVQTSIPGMDGTDGGGEDAPIIIPGPMGPQGGVGYAGPQGPIGRQGDDGLDGDQGYPGPMGPQGAAGVNGLTGPQGPIGRQGDDGLDGDQGNPGPMGPQGLQGNVGPIGPTGPIGPVGPTGLTGDIGPQGFPGINGEDGIDGADGIQGPAGAPGLPGPQGLQGLDGEDGQDGLIGPQGVPGVQGPTGLTGPMGLQGQFGIPGDDGLDGADGPMGPIGLTGAIGPAGATGPMGPQGIQGQFGIPGDDGQDGETSFAYLTATNATPVDFTVPYYIPTATSYTINVNKQALFAEDIEVDGTIDIEGHLLDVRSPTATFPWLSATTDAAILGPASTTYSTYSFAVGYNATAYSAYSTAIGISAISASDYSIAFGPNTYAGNAYNIAAGAYSTTTADYAIAIGQNSFVSGNGGVALGYTSSAYGAYSISFGYNSVTNSDLSVTISPNQQSSEIAGTVTTGSFNQYITGISQSNFAKTVNGTLWVRTADATPTNMYCANNNGALYLPQLGTANTVYYITVQFVGSDGTDILAGTDSFVVKIDGSYAATIHPGAGVLFDVQTAGATSWNFNNTVTSFGELEFQVTGGSTNISWSGSFTISQVTYG